ncbi:MAG: phage holin family protein [Candidatus Neomarinimicrobiota bacterium]|jgi:putative membrane protein
MKKYSFFTKIIINLISFTIVGTMFKGIHIDGLFTLIAMSVLFAILNASLKPFITLITLHITAMTYGIFYLLINGFMVWLTSSLIPGFTIANFATAFWAAILLSLVSWLGEMIFFRRER